MKWNIESNDTSVNSPLFCCRFIVFFFVNSPFNLKRAQITHGQKLSTKAMKERNKLKESKIRIHNSLICAIFLENGDKNDKETHRQKQQQRYTITMTIAPKKVRQMENIQISNCRLLSVVLHSALVQTSHREIHRMSLSYRTVGCFLSNAMYRFQIMRIQYM